MNSHQKLMQSGFSLIEIMVGLVIGLLATLVIVNVFSVFETQKRVTTGNSDAQTNGAIALYNLQRDVQLAGYALPVFGAGYSPYNCPTTGVGAPTYNHDNNAATPAIGLSPIVLIDSDPLSFNSSDTIAIRFGDSMHGGIGKEMLAGTLGNTAQVDNLLGCVINDAALIINTTSQDCNMVRISATASAPPRITFPASTVNVATDNVFACLGVWNEVRYSIDGNNQLTRTGAVVASIPSSVAVPIVTDVVNIQAQYGVSNAPASNEITQWVNPTGAWAAPSVNDRNRIKAVRIAIVARNGSLQPNNVTAACSSLTAANPTGLCAWDGGAAGFAAPAIDLSADADWQRYRYRVYQSIIPIRNLIWSGSRL